MDYSQLNTAAADEGGVVFTPVHPRTNEKLPGRWTLRSKNSEVVRAKSKAYLTRLQNDRNFRKTGAVDLDDAEEQGTQVLVACVINWHDAELDADVFQIGDERLPCTAANVRRVLADPGFAWLRKQIGDFTDEEANFFTKAAKASTPTPSASSVSPVPSTPSPAPQAA